MSGYRLAEGGRVDRTRQIAFSFDGVTYRGYAGDTLASALLANGVTLFGRSFKYHRPRGLLGAGSEEPNALVSVNRGPARHTPNLRATAVEIYDGLVATSQLAIAQERPGRDQRSPGDVPAGRFLQQDLHVAALGLGQAL
jgi:sarcosine oxidase subunit alpha